MTETDIKKHVKETIKKYILPHCIEYHRKRIKCSYNIKPSINKT